MSISYIFNNFTNQNVVFLLNPIPQQGFHNSQKQ